MAEVLGDGTFAFKVKKSDGTLVECSVDVISLRLACQEAEDTHRLPQSEKGGLLPTAEFLKTLTGLLAQSAGVKDCTPSIAYQLWIISGDLLDGLKKNMSEPPSSPSGMDSTPASSAENPEPGSTQT